MNAVIHRSNLLQQELSSRIRNIGMELERQLDMQFGITAVCGDDPLGLILRQIQELLDNSPRRNPSASAPAADVQLSALLVRIYPFLTAATALSLIRRAGMTVDQLISSINFEAGV